MTDNRHDESLFDGVEKTDAVKHLGELKIPTEGNVIGGRYQVQRVIDPRRMVVQHLGVQQLFLMRLAPVLSPGTRAERRLKEVAQSVGLLGHEALGFITDFGFGEAFGPYIVSQWVEGTSLAEYIEQGTQMVLEDVLDFALQIGGALASLHDVGVAHGLFAPLDLVHRPDGRWKLLGAGIAASPPDIPGFVPPEVQRYRDIHAAGDQYTFASILYHLLVGNPPEGADPFEPSELRADVPLDVDRTIARARSRDVSERYPSMDALLEELHSAFKSWHEPSMSPFDAREASRLLAMHPDTQERSGFDRRESTRKSVVVSIERLVDAPTRLEVQFASAARIKREYRRNIVARALFVPMADPIRQQGAPLEVRIEFLPTGDFIEVSGIVVSVHEGSPHHPSGVGVSFDPGQHERLVQFVRELEIGLGLRPDDLLEVCGTLDQETVIDAGQAFLYSRLEGAPLKVAAARSAVSGLPFDFDEALQALMEAGLVRRADKPVEPEKQVAPAKKAEPKPIEPRAPRRVSPRQPEVFEVDEEIPQPPAGLSAESSIALDKIQFSDEDADHILHVVDYFQEQQNYMSAIETLKRALEHAPREARFHHRAARMRAEFFGDYAGSLRSARRAIKYDPEHPEYRETLQYLKALQEAELLRPMIDINMPGFRFRLVRHDPEIHRLWVEGVESEQSRSRRLVAIDTRRGSVVSVVEADKPSTMRVIPGNHPRLSAFDERVPTAYRTLRERREKLLEMAQRASDYGPYFRTGPRPVAWCENSTFLVFDRDPRGGASGLFVTHEGRSSEPFRMDPHSRKSVSPDISHDEEQLAWVRVEPSPAVCVANFWEPPRDLLALQSEATLAWSDDSQHLWVVEHHPFSAHRVEVSSGHFETLELPVDGEALRIAFDSAREKAVVLVDGESTSLVGLDFENGEAMASISIGDISIREMAVREDGYAVAASNEVLVLANLEHGKSREIMVPRIAPMSLERNRWQAGEPLLVLLAGDDAIEVIELDPAEFGV